MMNEEISHIPSEIHFDFLGRTIEIHWDYHAILMVSIWFVLVPLCVIAIRYGKPKPKPDGIKFPVSISNPVWWWFSVHKYGLYTAIGLSLLGLAVAILVSRGFSGSIHSIFGLLTIALGCLQVISGMLRGTHGGKYHKNGDPDDPSTWHGDHFDMTPRRQKFEAYHKTAGYFAGFFAIGAVASGLMQYPMPILAGFILIAGLIILGVCVVLQYKGLQYDGYRAAHGNNPDHPYNQARKEL
jgi:hypothetical protein